MKSINKIEESIFNTKNTFIFCSEIKTLQLFILNLIVLFVSISDTQSKQVVQNRIYSLCITAKFNYKSFLKRYVIATYFNKMYNDTYFSIILQYLNECNYIDSISSNKKLLRYIQFKMQNKANNNCIIYMNEKNKITKIIF